MTRHDEGRGRNRRRKTQRRRKKELRVERLRWEVEEEEAVGRKRRGRSSIVIILLRFSLLFLHLILESLSPLFLPCFLQSIFSLTHFPPYDPFKRLTDFPRVYFVVVPRSTQELLLLVKKGSSLVASTCFSLCFLTRASSMLWFLRCMCWLWSFASSSSSFRKRGNTSMFMLLSLLMLSLILYFLTFNQRGKY